MAHPTIKWDNNREYSCEMLGGPYDKEGNKGPLPSKFDHTKNQWKYLIKVGDTPHYWYATDKAHEMIEARGYNVKGAPFSVLKRVDGTMNKGFVLSGESHDDIFGGDEQPPLPADNQPQQSPPNAAPSNVLSSLEDRMGTFAESVNDRFRKMSDEIKRLDGEISGVRKALEALGEPFPETAESQG